MAIYHHLSAPTTQLDNFQLADQLDRATVVIDNGGLATVVQPMATEVTTRHFLSAFCRILGCDDGDSNGQYENLGSM